MVGREPELEDVEQFIAGVADRGRCLVLEGPPGIGKTVLWRAGLSIAVRHGCRTLTATAREQELALGFTGLGDLLHGVSMDGLPSPQRRALDGALLLGDHDEPPDARALSAGVLTLMRSLAEAGPVLVAVDDVQWLDEPSAVPLAFALRRLIDEPVGVLLARRIDELPSGLESALPRDRVEPLAVEPLSLGATRRLLSARLGLALPRRTMRRVFESAHGNPLFALELGRLLQREGGEGSPGEEIPLPETIGAMMDERIESISAPARDALLATALAPGVHVAELRAAGLENALDDACRAGVLALDGDHVRLGHPLLGPAARRRARPAELRALHARMADATADVERAARHLALAAEGPDSDVADGVDRAAAHAAARGMHAWAAELAELAWRATPDGDPARAERLVVLAEMWVGTGDLERIRAVVEPALPSLPEGPLRARAHLTVSETDISVAECQRQLQLAEDEAGDDLRVRTVVLHRRANELAIAQVREIPAASVFAEEALACGSRVDDASEQLGLTSLAWTRALSGVPVGALLARERELRSLPARLYVSVERLWPLQMMWRGALDEARAAIVAARAIAEARGEAESYTTIRHHLCELELRRGEWASVSRLLDERAEETDLGWDTPAAILRCRAAVAAGRGDPEAVKRYVGEVAGAGESRWQALEAARAAGIAALLRGEPAVAVDRFGEVWQWLEREGVREPGAFPVAPDLVEAQVAVGALDDADAVTAALEQRAIELDHPWARAGAARSGALILAARRDDDAAVAPFQSAASEYQRLGFRLEHGRVLVHLGGVLRRLNRRSEGRAALEEAIELFDALESPGWVALARAELSRFGGRRASGNELTGAEERVARLVATGRRNREVASELFVSVAAVEANLSRVYAKLGIRSRTELAARLAELDAER